MNTPLPLYAPALIERDAETGQFWHPHLPFPGGADAVPSPPEMSASMAEQGDWIVVEPPAGFHACDGSAAFWQAMRDWQPTPPDGEGWQLACIAVDDVGPRAWFVRPYAALTPANPAA